MGAWNRRVVLGVALFFAPGPVVLAGDGVPRSGKAAPANELVVFGRVIDEDGKTPMEGVELVASAGIATLFRTGEARSDREGKFRLTFKPGVAFQGHAVGGVAIISARKPGWTGAAWAGPAQFLLTDEPMTKEQIRESRYRNITPGRPYELEFRMRRAAALKARLIGADGKPMAGARVWLTGDRLPPGSSVIDSGPTDAEGVFAVKDVPRDRFRLVLGEGKETRRELVLGEIEFRDAAEYDAEATVREWTQATTDLRFKVSRGKDLTP